MKKSILIVKEIDIVVWQMPLVILNEYMPACNFLTSMPTSSLIARSSPDVKLLPDELFAELPQPFRRSRIFGVRNGIDKLAVVQVETFGF